MELTDFNFVELGREKNYYWLPWSIFHRNSQKSISLAFYTGQLLKIRFPRKDDLWKTLKKDPPPQIFPRKCNLRGLIISDLNIPTRNMHVKVCSMPAWMAIASNRTTKKKSTKVVPSPNCIGAGKLSCYLSVSPAHPSHFGDSEPLIKYSTHIMKFLSFFQL